ncbi:hypothetical protein EFA69_06920 [Rufibacter immobilis]|uniref:Carboxypeptidase-like regulatory domain-containing protein n=2 Tax=Rufibacter immobilis TaxID=1348778 RepID=A0A3M9MZB2_9BACT|nr:hypothetical protein EFA69_06920 [Rufibacter immobilis]
MTQCMNALFSMCLLLVLCSPMVSQAAPWLEKTPQKGLVTGIVVDAGTGETIGYASVGVVETETGTIADEEGSFSLTVPEAHFGKTLRISAIGYAPKDVKVDDLITQTTREKRVKVSLTATPVALPEVQVNASTWKKKLMGGKLGTQTKFTHSFVIYPRPLLANFGREIGIQIGNGKHLSFLNELNFYLHTNKYEEVLFRLNVYYLKNGKPAQNLLSEPIYVSVEDRKTGWIKVDLEPYNLYVEEDFVISLEWVDCYPKTHSQRLALSASLPGLQTTLFKDASQSKWTKVPAVNMGMNVVLQQKE